MQSCAVAAVFLLISFGAHATSFSSEAESWLSSHRNPQADELAELKDENPGAYALVKALLTKRSLGLLDPKHPTASFAGKPAQSSQEVPGPEAFEKLASMGGHIAAPAELAEPEVSLYAESPVHQHHDFFNWKPEDSAVDEDAEVKNVLGAVAELASKPSVSAKSSLRGSTDEATPKQIALPTESTQADGQDVGKVEEVQQTQAHSALSSFSWDDDHQSAAPKLAAVESSVSEKTAKAQVSPANPLFAWLDNGKAAKPSIALAAQASTTPKAENSYLHLLD